MILGVSCRITPVLLPQLAPAVSRQDNSVDCGVYLLGFADAILRNISDTRLEGNADEAKLHADRLFHWLQLPADVIGSLRERICDTIQELSKNSIDVFAADSSGDSDVEEVNTPSHRAASWKEETKRPRIAEDTQNACDSPQTGIRRKEGSFVHEENYKRSQKQMVSLFHLRPEASKKPLMRINDVKRIPGIEKG